MFISFIFVNFLFSFSVGEYSLPNGAPGAATGSQTSGKTAPFARGGEGLMVSISSPPRRGRKRAKAYVQSRKPISQANLGAKKTRTEHEIEN